MTTDLSHIRILVAEDNSINRFVIKKILEKWNVQLDMASDGAEAVEKFKNDPKAYDILFLDLQMPIMDGLEAAKIIRELDAEIPMVAITAAVLDENRKDSKNAGMNDFVGKPFRQEEIYDIIQRWCPKKD